MSEGVSNNRVSVRRRKDDADAHADANVTEIDGWMMIRHSSPLVRLNSFNGSNNSNSYRSSSSPTPMERRPSPSLINRPRSNPRSLTPTMRYQSPLNNTTPNGNVIPEDDNEEEQPRRITIRAMAGRAVGAIAPTTSATSSHRLVPTSEIVGTGGRSMKQGPSHRKVRRWNNDNFVNLAAEIGNGKAAQVLVMGHADSSKYRPICDFSQSKPTVLTRLLCNNNNNNNSSVKDQFFEGTLHPKMPVSSSQSKNNQRSDDSNLTPEQMLHRIEPRLRRVIVRACENSLPASCVVQGFEAFLVYSYNDNNNKTKNTKLPSIKDGWWDGILIEPPTITLRKRDDSVICRFLFNGKSPNAGFHRLLLHGVCQFHGLQATSTTMEVAIQGKQTQVRLLTTTGMSLSGPEIKLVDCIMSRRNQTEPVFGSGFDNTIVASQQQ